MIYLLKALKALAALGLVVCLFLPLSQCTSSPEPVSKKEPRVYERYVVMHKDIGIPGYLPALFFVLPIIVVLLNITIPREKLRYALLELLSGLLALSVVFLHMKTGKLILGGYLAMGSALTYIVATVVEMVNTIRYRHHERVGLLDSRKSVDGESEKI